jgi:Tfp pilus assembly protein PilF
MRNMKSMAVWMGALGAMCLVGCAPIAAQHRGDTAFRSALAAQLGGDEGRAEELYRSVVALGLEWSAVYNNLAVIAVHRHEPATARALLRQAVAADARDVVALTNYGVVSYWLDDYAEARRTLAEARELRKRLVDSTPSVGTNQRDAERYARETEALDRVAQRYLERMDKQERPAKTRHACADELVAEIASARAL